MALIVKNTVFTNLLKEVNYLSCHCSCLLWCGSCGLDSKLDTDWWYLSVKSVVFLIAFFLCDQNYHGCWDSTVILVPLRNSACRISNFCKIIILFRDSFRNSYPPQCLMCFSFWCQAQLRGSCICSAS